MMEAALVVFVLLATPAVFVLLFAVAWMIRGRWKGGRAI
jgi:hypothetical protein